MKISIYYATTSCAIAVFGLLFFLVTNGLLAADAPPAFRSEIVTTKTPGHAVEIDVDITGAKELYLFVGDGGDNFSCDWANWAEPRLVGPDGEKRLTELRWKSASAAWGEVRVNRNCNNGAMRIDGKPVEYGIGTHAHSLIVYELPAGYTRFKARGGIDNGGSDQQSGAASSVQFFVFTQTPPPAILNVARGDQNSPEMREPENAVAGLKVHEELEATLFASEPMITNLTNLDVDHRGRVWVCDVVNYRGHNGKRPEGDRILILEDTDGDGRADSCKTFYQGRDVDSAMGVCVLGNKVIVSAAPYIIVFTDEDGDDVPDKKEYLFTKTGQPQHDHSNHAFVFGPDGKLYWNFGNTGRAVHDRDGNIVVDKAGNEVRDNGKPYRQGMVFRCNLDGGEFEVLGHNFRNNYEVAIDSFGTLWQSDNDDDGNRGVRINYVMEFGNFGYVDEMTGAGWNAPRTNMEKEIAARHWHQNDPGVVPNVLHTGAGSPCGIMVYEGRLLPEVFWDQMIHCDAGPNVVRAYPVKKQGAGYTAEMVDLLKGEPDNWFRPSDVCAAPDGSLFVADWYDPGVGGHAQRDSDRGRLFRVAPPGHKYIAPQFDFSTPYGAVEALKSPNQSVRYMAYMALKEMGAKAETALRELFEKSDNPRHQARALWLLGRIEGRAKTYLDRAARSGNPDLRVVAVRMARAIDADLVVPVLKLLLEDPAPEVRRECAIALREAEDLDALELWWRLARHYDGKDRFYLEALGIGAEGRWSLCFDGWFRITGRDEWGSPAVGNIVWRSRFDDTPMHLADYIRNPATPLEDLPRYFRAFDFQSGAHKTEALLKLAFADSEGPAERAALIAGESLKRLNSAEVKANDEAMRALAALIERSRGSQQFIELVGQFELDGHYADLLAMSCTPENPQLAVLAMQTLLAKGKLDLVRQSLAEEDVAKSVAAAAVLGMTRDGRCVECLLPIVTDENRPTELRQTAARSLAKTRGGAEKLLELIEGDKLDESIRVAPAVELVSAEWNDIRAKAASIFPPPPTKDNDPLPPLAELVKLEGDPERGKLIYAEAGTCAKCHQVNREGKEVGPDLSEIGGKLSRVALYESILYPSAGISHNYETHSLALDDGNIVSGIITSRTPEAITLKTNEGVTLTYPADRVEEITKLSVSLMPADLQRLMTRQELVDLIAYLETLRAKE